MGVEIVFFTYNSLLERHLQKISRMEKKQFSKAKTNGDKPNEAVKTVTKSESAENGAEGIKPNEAVKTVTESRSTESGTKEHKAGKKQSELFYSVVANVAGGVLAAIIIAFATRFTSVYRNIMSIPNMATKDDIVGMVKTDDIANMVTTDDISNMVTTDDIANMATTDKIDNIINQVNELKERVGKVENNYNELNRTLGRIEGRLGTYLDADEELINKTNASCNSYENAYNESDNYVWEDLKLEVGRDYITGDIYTAEDLEDEIVILSYIDENNDEVFFKGSFNENNQWEGNCIINKYSNGNLKYIMNANYESGRLVTYNQVFSYVNSSNITVWAISSRTVGEEGNAGQTWTYFKEREWKKDFENEYLVADNIIDEKYFENRMNLKKEGYYNGYTSDGYFNDKSESAYMVKYSMDGYIRMFYSGQFVDGQPHDLTGNASVIAFGHDEENYYYYKGMINDISKIGDGWEKIPVEEVKKKFLSVDYSESLFLYGEVV